MACEHYHRAAEDVALMAELGRMILRLSTGQLVNSTVLPTELILRATT